MTGLLKSVEKPFLEATERRTRYVPQNHLGHHLIQFAAECAQGKEAASFYSQNLP